MIIAELGLFAAALAIALPVLRYAATPPPGPRRRPRRAPPAKREPATGETIRLS